MIKMGSMSLVSCVVLLRLSSIYGLDMNCIISEVNAVSQGEEFVEIECTEFTNGCKNSSSCSLSGYYLMFVKALDTRLQQPALHAVIDLSNNSISRTNPHFVIGDSAVR